MRLLCVVLLILTCRGMAQETRPLSGAAGDFGRAVETYCASCHRGPRAKAKIDFDRILLDPVKERESLLLAVEQIRAKTMPPEKKPAPNDLERAAMVAAARQLLERDGSERAVTMRRLTREEFAITVEDVFGVHFDAPRTFPAEAPAYGFDAVGDVMSIPPLLLEKYFDAATAVAKSSIADAAARARLFPESPLDEAALVRALERLLLRAFRRPAGDAEIVARVALFGAERSAGRDESAALEKVIASIVLSPYFLFRVEVGVPGEKGAERRLSAAETATRLAYFLTSGPPDDRLLERVRDGSILDDRVLIEETERLLAGKAPRRLAEHFFAQWLRYREVLTAAADFRRYPKIWNDHLKPAMYEEAVLFTEDIVKENRDVRRLLDSDETFVDPPLAEHYGIPGVGGGGFRRVKLPDRRRGGVITMGAVLMATSYPLRTSPVLRGRWILDEILGDPPPAPPAGVPPLPKDDQEKDGLTPRARLERHRKDPACAACHARIDPLGLALENYDVMGVWRDKIGEFAIDSAAVLPDGRKVSGPVELKDRLLEDGDAFVRTMTEKLATYAVGRAFGPADRAEISAIAADVCRDGGRFGTMVKGIVRARFFTHLARGREAE